MCSGTTTATTAATAATTNGIAIQGVKSESLECSLTCEFCNYKYATITSLQVHRNRCLKNPKPQNHRPPSNAQLQKEISLLKKKLSNQYDLNAHSERQEEVEDLKRHITKAHSHYHYDRQQTLKTEREKRKKLENKMKSQQQQHADGLKLTKNKMCTLEQQSEKFTQIFTPMEQKQQTHIKEVKEIELKLNTKRDEHTEAVKEIKSKLKSKLEKERDEHTKEVKKIKSKLNTKFAKIMRGELLVCSTDNDDSDNSLPHFHQQQR
jgi:DNA repair exonuclease SbcCD ATPase subunit